MVSVSIVVRTVEEFVLLGVDAADSKKKMRREA